MTDLNKIIMEKAQGNLQLKPDEQRKFLETFAERVIATATIEEAENPQLKKKFSEILGKIIEQYQPVFVKISPSLGETSQIFYMKIAQEKKTQVTIVSEQCEHSPFGLVIHTDQAIELEETDVFKEYADLLDMEKESIKAKKEGFWKKLFG